MSMAVAQDRSAINDQELWLAMLEHHYSAGCWCCAVPLKVIQNGFLAHATAAWISLHMAHTWVYARAAPLVAHRST